ncbi:hypothetical protein M7793_22270 [Enterobacter hormaechei subsp. hoffmannii]|uniref:hypothetical protein n=1 Tax=Enterobacter cloacae complex TaxID=354276 RepID=UPI000EF9FCF6|nr:hypothetical protein [Enterobacter hormaechei]EBD6766780.1 hypothetical protein [Salmonella enterica subsp. enterica serovar Johannesburg]MCW4873748.1 hypothetical protein [Enterobacter hormaechei subsp. hoffmannii]RLZ16127.1 hypothetical protein EA136_21645 [Enterobacter hormaechei subsp. hoffmannii]
MANGHGGARAGAGRKRSPLPKQLTDNALKRLSELVEEGDVQAVRMVIDRSFPALKSITPIGTLDAELLKLKIKELSEFEERLAALEASNGK